MDRFEPISRIPWTSGPMGSCVTILRKAEYVHELAHPDRNFSRDRHRRGICATSHLLDYRAGYAGTSFLHRRAARLESARRHGTQRASRPARGSGYDLARWPRGHECGRLGCPAVHGSLHPNGRIGLHRGQGIRSRPSAHRHHRGSLPRGAGVRRFVRPGALLQGLPGARSQEPEKCQPGI